MVSNAGAKVKLTLNGFDRYKAAIDPVKFQQVLQRNIGRTTAQNGKRIERAMRQTIKAGIAPPNAALTIAIKKSSKPLVDKGSGIFQAIKSEVISWDAVFIGVKRNSASYNIAKTLVTGVSIKVTEKMRWMFKMLFWASIGNIPSSKLTGRAAELWARMPGEWKPLSPSTKAIFIPGRNFAAAAFNDPVIIKACVDAWTQAAQRALNEMAR